MPLRGEDIVRFVAEQYRFSLRLQEKVGTAQFGAPVAVTLPRSRVGRGFADGVEATARRGRQGLGEFGLAGPGAAVQEEVHSRGRVPKGAGQEVDGFVAVRQVGEPVERQ